MISTAVQAVLACLGSGLLQCTRVRLHAEGMHMLQGGSHDHLLREAAFPPLEPDRKRLSCEGVRGGA